MSLLPTDLAGHHQGTSAYRDRGKLGYATEIRQGRLRGREFGNQPPDSLPFPCVTTEIKVGTGTVTSVDEFDMI